MKQPQLLLALFGLVAVVLIYQLPKVVVENNKLQEVSGNPGNQQHSLEIPSEVRFTIEKMKDSLVNISDNNKRINFALSLAKNYLDYGVLDSAVYYGDQVAEWLSEPSNQVADIYFKAYERSSNTQKGSKYASKAEAVYEVLLEKDPTNHFLKNRLAMTLVVSDNPMSGITMLREIVEEDPENRQAILNLGLLAIQSGQFERAKERFEKLLEINPIDHEAKLYLAVSLIEINDQDRARSVLNEILASQDSIPAIRMMAEDYLNSL